MTSVYEFFAILAILYVVECLLAVRRDALVLWSPGWGGYRLTRAANLPGSLERGLFLCMPLPPLGRTFVTQFWPLSISPEGVSARRVQHVGAEEAVHAPARFIAMDAIRDCAAVEDRVQINGEIWARSATPAAAADLALMIMSISRLPAAGREAAILKRVRMSLDVDAARATLDAAVRRAANLRIVTNLLTVHLLVVIPYCAIQLGLAGTWQTLLVALAVFWPVAAIEFNRAHRALYPELVAERRHRTLLASLTPIAAARACDPLLRQRLAAFHPLAAVAAAGGDDLLRPFAADVLADLLNPCATDAAESDAAGERTASWLRASMIAAVRSLFEKLAINEADLLAVPVPEDARCKVYCPRCRSQFVEMIAVCSHCPGVSVRPLLAAAAA